MGNAHDARDELIDSEENADAAIAALDKLLSFMHSRQAGKALLERPSDDPEAWKVDLSWFASAEADAFPLAQGNESLVSKVFGFAKAAAQGYVFIHRSATKPTGVEAPYHSTRFLGFQTRFVPIPGMVLLDATAEIDGISQLALPWRKPHDVPKADYSALDIVHVPMPFKVRNVSRFLKRVENRAKYMDWMCEVIKAEVASGQKALIVCKQVLFENGHIPIAAYERPEGSDDPFLWNLDGRHCAAIHWGEGIGRNDWREADVVLQFDQFHLPRRTVLAIAQGLRGMRTDDPDAPIASMRADRSRSDDVTILSYGHLLRWDVQLGLRGKGRVFNEHGQCSPQKIVHTGDKKLFLRLLQDVRGFAWLTGAIEQGAIASLLSPFNEALTYQVVMQRH